MVTFAVKNDVRQCQPSVYTFIVGFHNTGHVGPHMARFTFNSGIKYTTTTTILWPLYRSNCISRHFHLQQEDFVGEEFYCPHAFADSNQHIQITEKTLEFSSTVSYSVSIPLNTNGLVHCCYYWLLSSTLRCGDSVAKTVVENSSIFSLIRMCWLPSSRACGQYNFAPTESSSS